VWCHLCLHVQCLISCETQHHYNYSQEYRDNRTCGLVKIDLLTLPPPPTPPPPPPQYLGYSLCLIFTFNPQYPSLPPLSPFLNLPLFFPPSLPTPSNHNSSCCPFPSSHNSLFYPLLSTKFSLTLFSFVECINTVFFILFYSILFQKEIVERKCIFALN
jgi:hypothetical protein